MYGDLIKEAETEEKCPNQLSRLVGDEVWVFCTLEGRLCTLEYNGMPCEEWENIKREWANEN